jgi:hypothetical protein
VGPVTLAITTKPLQRPKYSGAHLHDFQLWFRDNEPKLQAWYDETARYCDPRDHADFMQFCLSQHDVELMRLGRKLGDA